MVRIHAPISFKQLKELKSAYSQYGSTVPFTQALLESLSTEALCPGEWKQLVRACLSGGDYLLWKSEFEEHCQVTGELNRAQGVPITYAMLAGEGIYREIIGQQLDFDLAVYAQVNAAARRAWNKLPQTGRQVQDLSKICQGPDELFQDFVARLMQAASRLVGDTDSRLLLVKHLAYENANSACQAALRPFRKKGNISEYIRLCSDIRPSYTQGVAMAAALQGKTIKEALFQQQKGPKNGVSGSCYGCGQMGHQRKKCPNASKKKRNQKDPGLCPRCKRGKHWANECKSKRDAAGNPLTWGNWKRGQPQAPQQCYGALQNMVPQQGDPFRTSVEQPQVAQGWTSVPPPTQY
ncbi:endogenous retrovirus group K member 24 Gag polyprotein-like [Meriones unguiculatus]|uniref:endogenous retrovirus group K member 24 Gag polyprotein-like n=1 Tax=Meriones unguiculatus TaxID=10047 RepID=UPI00293E098D|nr:endogenous retrovirus group K member 24 Gag polyprotein-like [Meriones unguiculatus]